MAQLADTTAVEPSVGAASGDVNPPGSGVTALDVLALGSLVLLALLSWASLGLAHLGVHSLPAVLAVTALAAAAVLLVVRRWARPRVRPNRAGVAVALACAAVSLALTMFGFSYGAADKDPGVYVSHAISIAHTGDVAIHDDLLAQQGKDPTFPVRLVSPGARMPGIWVDEARTGRLVPQFYHLWPALLATAFDAGGFHGLRAVTPLVGTLSVLVLCALLLRVGELAAGRRGGLVVSAIGGLLLATNMMQVWQARYPTTEILSQALFLGALLGLVVAMQEGWKAAAGAAGLFIGVGWLNRPDGVLLYLLAVGLGASLLALGRWDRRAWWFTAALAIVLPHAMWQAYDAARSYTLSTEVPSLRTVTVLTAGCLGAAATIRLLLKQPLARAERWLLEPRRELAIGALVLLGAVGLLALGFLRPRLFGADMMDYNGHPIRSYDEQNLRRLSWFLTLPAFGLLPVGIAVVTLRRWRAALWAVLLPTLLLLPVYVYASRNSSRLMWWTRRYVPTVLPGIVILIAVALGAALMWRYRGRTWLRLPALLVTAGLLAVFVSQSLPVRRHDEFRGSFEAAAQIASVAHGRHGIFLWEPDSGCCSGATHLFPTSVWLQQDQDSALLAADDPATGQSPMAMLAAYRKAFASRPLFVVTGRGQLPAGVDPTHVRLVKDLQVSMPVWDESDTTRPSGSHPVAVHVLVWQVVGSGQGRA